MVNNTRLSRSFRPALLIVLLLVSVSLLSSAFAAGSHPITPPAESLLIGGSSCSDFMDGFSVGMGIAALLGCGLPCAAGAVAAKAIGLFC